ncbi:MAG TPA: tetratricopeptide repeat protein [Fibrobacteria bacterium]|nr:tetratricopeptide repeat protein [Fibrobacteria bacterium]
MKISQESNFLSKHGPRIFAAAFLIAGLNAMPAWAAPKTKSPQAQTAKAAGTGDETREREFQAAVEKILDGNVAGMDTAGFLVELENRIARKPGNDSWQEAAATLHFQVGRFDQARRALAKLRKPSARSDRMMALSLFETKEYRKSLAYFGRMKDVRSDREDWQKMCIALSAGGSRADALKEWEAFRARFAGTDAGLEYLAEYYRRPLQKEKLIPALEGLLKKAKGANGAPGREDEGPILLELSGLYGETNVKAVEYRTQYLKLHPEDFTAARGLAAMLEARGEIKKAVPIYLDIAPRFASDLKYNRHLADLLARPDREKALLFYETCRTLSPKDAEIPLIMARIQEELKRPDLALEAYKAVLDINPTHPDAKNRMVALAGSRPEPGPWLKTMVENEKKNPRDHAFQFQLAKLFLNAKDKDNAYKYLQKALQNSSDKEEYTDLLPLVITSDAQILKHFALLQKMAQRPAPTAQLLLLVGRGFSLYKNQAKAAEAYARVLRMDAGLLEGHRQPILDLYGVKDYGAAVTLSERFLAQNPKDADILRINVSALSETGAPAAKLRAAIQNLVAADPYDDQWYYRLAELDLAARDTAAAIKHGREWTKMHPGDKRGLLFVEPLAARAKDGELYFATLDNLSRLEPANQSAYELKMGYFFFESGKWSHAAEALTKLMSAFPNDAKFWNRLGVSQAKLGREGAEVALEKAYRLEPNNADYARAFAACLASDAELKANLDVFRMLGRNNPGKEERRKLARALYLSGEYGAAAREWDWFVSNDPALIAADSTAGLSFLRAGQVNKAKPILEKRLAANPRDVGLLATLSEVYAKEGDGKRKMGMMERLVQEDQSVGDYLLRLAKDKEKAGQSAEALTLYSQWTFRHQEDAAALKSYRDLAERQKDTTAIIEALRYLILIKPPERAYRFQLAELYFARSGETKELEELVKANPDYRQGKLLLIWEYHAKRSWQALAGLEPFLAAEAASNAALLEPLGDLYAWQKKTAQAHQAYYAWLAVKRKDRDVFDKVYAYASENKSPNLTSILKLGCDNFPQDLSLMADYAASLGTTRSALEAYQALLAKSGNDGAAIEKAAELARALGDKGAQAKWSKRWSEIKPLEEKPWRYLIESLDPASAGAAGADKARLADALEGLLRLQSGNLELILRLARLQESLGRYDKAIGLYRNALYLAPKDKSIRDRLIAIMKDKGKKEDLADVLTEIQNIDSSAHEAQYELAKLFLQKQDKTKAYAYLSTALELSPLNQNYQRLLPHAIHGKEQILRHFKLLQEIAARPETSRSDANNADLFLLLGQGYGFKGQWEPAAAHLAMAYRLAPKRLWGDREAVMAFYRGKNHALTAELADKFFELNTDFDKEIRQVQILSYEKTMKDPAVIRKALQLLLAVDKENAGGLLRLAELDLRARDTSAAITNIRACLTTSPNELRAFKMLLPLVNPVKQDQRVTYVVILEKLAQLDSLNKADHLIRLADFYFGRKTYRQTARLLSEATELRPKDAESWFRLGQCRNHLQVGDLGVDCFRKAYELKPSNLPFAHTYAQALQTPEEFKANLKLYQFVEDRDPSLHERFGLAMAYFYNGDNQGSAKAWDRLAAAKAGEEPKWIPEAALAYARTNQYGKALAFYRLRREREAGNLGLLDTLCNLFAKTGDEKGRVETLESLVRVDAAYKDYQLQLARAKEKSRDTAAAIENYGQWTARNNADAEALKAMHRLAQGKRDTASLENALRMLVAIKGQDPEYSFQLAELQFKFTGDPAQLEKLVKAHPQYHRGRVILAREYFRRYDIPRMIPFEKALAEETSKDRELLGPLAELYAYQDKKAPAHKAFRDYLVYRRDRALADNAPEGKTDLRQAFDKAWLYGDANKSPFLAEVLDIGNRNFPGEPPIQHALATALGKDPRALELYRQILAEDPNDLAALRSGSELAMGLGKTKDAVAWLERWTALEATSSRAWQLLADAYLQLKDLPKVADALDHQMLLSPTDAALAFRTGQAYLDAKNREKALEFLIRADELKPKDPTYSAEVLELLRSATEEHLAKGETAKAIELYGMMLERDPKHKKANLYMGMWMAENRDYGSAGNMLKIGLDQSPEARPVLAKAWRLLGDCQAASGQNKPALEAYKRALGFDDKDKAAAAARLDMTRALNLQAEIPVALADVVRLDSGNVDACLALGELRLKASDFPAAAALYRRAALARDNDADAWARYGDALEGAKRNPEAMQAWDKAYALGDRNAYTLQGLSRLHRETGSLDKAEAALEDLVAMQPDNDEACAWLGELALKQGNLEKAEEMYAQASQGAPDKIEYTQGLGEIYLRRGDAESALEILEPAKARLSPAGRLTLADALRATGKTEAALPLYQEAGQKEPSARAVAGLADALLDRSKPLDAKKQIEASAFAREPEVRLRLGRALLALRDRDKAEEILRALVKQDKENPAYLYDLARVHYEQKNLSQALKEFKDVLRKRADMAGAAYHSGMILLSQGQVSEARAFFFSLAQSAAKPDRALGLRGLAAASQAEKNLTEASDYLVQASEVFPTPEVMAELSEISLTVGNPKDAESWAQKSLEADEDYPRGIVALAEAMLAQGQKDEARDFLKESLTRNPRACEVHLESQKVNLALENMQGIASNSRQVLTLCPDEPLSYFYAGMAADRSYQKKQAEEYFKFYKKLGGDKSVLPKGY